MGKRRGETTLGGVLARARVQRLKDSAFPTVAIKASGGGKRGFFSRKEGTGGTPKPLKFAKDGGVNLLDDDFLD